jgi:peptidyl-prolyl cis-trans isomerase SurA
MKIAYFEIPERKEDIRHKKLNRFKMRIMIRKVNILVLLVLITFSTTLLEGQERTIIDKVIAKVGGEIVLLSDLEQQYALLKAESGFVPDDARCIIMDNLLTQRLLLNQAKLDSIVVGEQEVEQQLNARLDRILRFMNNDIAQFEAYYGRTITEVKAQFREDLRNQLLVERMQGQLMQEASITPKEVKTFFKRIPQDSLPYFNSEVEIGEIVYFPEVNEEERQKAIDKLNEIRRRILEGGEDFAELAAVYSDDASARGGGDLGWAKRGDYVPEFEAAAYNLDKEEISDVVESEFGFHLIQLLERRGNSIHVRHILIKPEITSADLEEAKTKLETVRRQLMADSLSFSQAVKKYSSEKLQSYNNDGRMINPQTGNTIFETGQLEPDVYFTIDTLEIGDFSRPYMMTDARGEKAYRIIWLQSRTRPHIASLEKDYAKIRQAALEEKRNILINEWVEEKLDATFIKIAPAFKGCDVLQKWYSKDPIRP